MSNPNEPEELSPETSKFPLPEEPMQMDVTPDMASDWLSHRNSPRNRPLSTRVSSRYQRDMASGLWIPTPQGYAFDTDGWLIDGQHRLRAQANAGITLPMWVFPDQLREAYGVYDQGWRRSPSQMLAIPYAPMVAAALRHILAAKNMGLVGLGPFNSITTPEILAASKEWPEVAWYNREVFTVWSNTRIPQAPHAAVLALAARTEHIGKIKPWLEGLHTGADLRAGDPRLVLRNRYMNNYQSLSGLTKRELDWRQIVKTWNAFVTGEKINILVARSTEPPAMVTGFSFDNDEQSAPR